MSNDLKQQAQDLKIEAEAEVKRLEEQEKAQAESLRAIRASIKEAKKAALTYSRVWEDLSGERYKKRKSKAAEQPVTADAA